MNLRDLLAFVVGAITGGGIVGYILHRKHERDLDATYEQLSTIKERVNNTGPVDQNSLNADLYGRGAPGIASGNASTNRSHVSGSYPLGDPIVEDDEEEVSEDEEEDPEIEDLDEVPGTDVDELDLEETKARIGRGENERQKEWDLAKLIFNISDTDFFEGEPEYDKLCITYHPKDQSYTDEQEELIDDSDKIIGKGLLFFGLRSGDKDIVYIRNKRLHADIEISRAKE